jgi:hypothetical protein
MRTSGRAGVQAAAGVAALLFACICGVQVRVLSLANRSSHVQCPDTPFLTRFSIPDALLHSRPTRRGLSCRL